MLSSWQRALYLPLIVLAWLAIFLIQSWLLAHIVKTLLTLLLSGIVAIAATPLVNLLARRVSRGLAIALAYVLAFSVLLGLVVFLGATAVAQVTALVNHLPQYAQQAQSAEPRLLSLLRPFGVTATALHATEQQAIATVRGVATTAVQQSLGRVSGVVATVIEMILILILSVYLTANGPRIARRLRSETPGAQRWRTSRLIDIVNQVVAETSGER